MEIRVSARALAGFIFAVLQGCGAGHYTASCASDEVTGEVQGETGVICAPRCAANTYECSLDVPAGTRAQPQCMLQNIDQSFFCGLLCQDDTQCPSGASCRKVGSQQVGLCVHPVSFTEWAKLSSRTKLTIGFPTATASSAANSKSYQIAKAYAALQSMKRRHSIPDGDADVLVVKELLSALSASTSRGSATGLLSSVESLLGASATPSKSGNDNSLTSAVTRDMQFLGGSLERGLPGLERELDSVVWKVEHFEEYGAASSLLRGVIEAAIIYLICGCVYKHQALGARGIEMIPHITFWKDYPALVSDGIMYANQLVAELTGRKVPSLGGGSKGSSSAFMPIGGRDNFSEFEQL